MQGDGRRPEGGWRTYLTRTALGFPSEPSTSPYHTVEAGVPCDELVKPAVPRAA
jgi:hypothetical protein